MIFRIHPDKFSARYALDKWSLPVPTHNVQPGYKPYPKEELNNSKVLISFEAFLATILRVFPKCRGQENFNLKARIDKIAYSPKYTNTLWAYAETARTTDCHHPFTALVTHAIEQGEFAEMTRVSFQAALHRGNLNLMLVELKNLYK